MSDIYNSKIARLLGRLNGATQAFAVTISSTCTIYNCPIEQVSPEHREHEDGHKARIKSFMDKRGVILGWCDFMATYIWRLTTVGYVKSDLEQ